MAHTAKTALLTPNWDLQLTPEGNILLTSGALAIAQNLANEIRLWTNDAYFQQANGIAWKEVQLAKKLDSSVLAQIIHEAGNRVSGVKSVDSVTVTAVDEESRTLHGEITITTESGETLSFVF
ncbi:hypothetical protein [uncultured Parasutterella sp.]|uniref:hypothetical protein n=1 Tax=uncultured Parasutterella sp. TaxID=1263098 RepID=UPI002599B273|nr:hypothetical protein [uncultured Parasutterella sp.]